MINLEDYRIIHPVSGIYDSDICPECGSDSGNSHRLCDRCLFDEPDEDEDDDIIPFDDQIEDDD